MKTKLFSLLALAIAFSAASLHAAPPLRTVPSVDPLRFSGKWFEAARLPNFFQPYGSRSAVTYTFQGNRYIVQNWVVPARGKTQIITGAADFVPGGGGTRLMLRFPGPNAFAPAMPGGNYWILGLDPNYTMALVGTPDRQFLWIYSRVQHPDPRLTQRLVQRARQLGYNTNGLVWSQW